MLFRFATFALGIACAAAAVPMLAPGLFRGVSGEDAGAETTVVAKPPSTGSNSRKIVLRADASGHVVVDAVIDGLSVEMMVDTGATTVALTEATARRLGVKFAKSGYTLPISTANGVIYAAPVKLDEIRVGGIRIRDVEAMVVPGEDLGVNLLGMSFLRRLTKFEQGGGQLILVQ